MMDLSYYPSVAEQATGVLGAGNYRQEFLKRGYPYLKVLDWTSSAGDWSFMVSKDEIHWFCAWQENRFPKRGFNYGINEEDEFCGTSDEVFEELNALVEYGYF